MHLYNKLLPLPVVVDVEVEAERFKKVVQILQRTWEPQNPSTALTCLKWVSIINTFVKAKTELAIADMEILARTILDILLRSSDNLFIQTKLAYCLARILLKYRDDLYLEIEWQPLYKLLLNTHFKCRSSYEGLWVKFSHLDNIVYLVEACRRFFPQGSAAEVWSEFRPDFDNVSHNSALEAAGFIALFLPTKFAKRSERDHMFFSSTWLAECLKLWSAVPDCYYWNLQWTLLLSRCMKHGLIHPSTWEPFLPELFTNFLNAFDVPVGKAGAWSPVYRSIPYEIKCAFNSRRSPSLSTIMAKSIVYLLSPHGSAQSYFDKMVDCLEQYYHPSNGGSWTGALNRFLQFLVFYFMKRLAHEQHARSNSPVLLELENNLGPTERAAFVRSVVKLIGRGQFSKDGALSSTVASAASRLSYIEPSIVLPLVISRFHTALETITATHQLESALYTIALSARALLLQDISCADSALVESRTALVEAMFRTLPGLDANDPPKTLATMQFYCSILSSVKKVGKGHGFVDEVPIDWSLWVDEFLDRLFVLLVNLEPISNSLGDAATDEGFLTEEGSYYSCLVGVMFRKMTESLYEHALRRVAKFLHSNILPRAVEEVGMLCRSAIVANPLKATGHLLEPIMKSLVSSLMDSPSTGFSGTDNSTASADFKVGLSPALEMTTTYQLNLLSKGMVYGGAALPSYKVLLKKVISAAFDAPSSKVNDAGNSLLSAMIESMILYYPTNPVNSFPLSWNSSGLDPWISSKERSDLGENSTSIWHIPNHDELTFVHEMVDQHVRGALATLQKFCEDGCSWGQEKEHLRVLLLRLHGGLSGLGSCLPDFCSPIKKPTVFGENDYPLTIVGAAGATFASPELREEAANTLHSVCEYMLQNRRDDSILLKMLVSVMDMVGNYGSVEYATYLQSKSAWKADSKILIEPCANFITRCFSNGKRRPWWLMIERAYIHSIWRASQAGYQCFYEYENTKSVPFHMALLSRDLLKLSLHSYSAVRLLAAASLEKMLQRYPSLVQECMPLLTLSLEDPKATEESALGSCALLMSRPVIRHLRKDWSALTSFLLALLGSAHHDSVKAQNAIEQLFVMFNISFGGIPSRTSTASGYNEDGKECITYSRMVSHVKNLLQRDSRNIHWRYNLMAHGILLFLTLAISYQGKYSDPNMAVKMRQAVSGSFLTNLKSELPPLRPLSVIALLFLLEASPQRNKKNGVLEGPPCQGMYDIHHNSMENTIMNVLKDHKFGENVINKLALDRHSVEKESYMPQKMSDAGLTAYMPTYMRQWPHTNTWESNMAGEQFSATSAKLFKRLIQEFESIVLDALRGPLEAATGAWDDHGKQCIFSEIMAGILHSDTPCVVAAWDIWIQPLLQKILSSVSLESLPEWAACIRFAVGGKGRNGRRIPKLRYQILKCISEPLPLLSSTYLVTKQLALLQAALVEVLPLYSSREDVLFQERLLDDLINLDTHPAPQVREYVGSLLCILLANLLMASKKQQCRESGLAEQKIADNLCAKLVNKAQDAATEIIRADTNSPTAASSSSIIGSWTIGNGSSDKENKNHVRQMESILNFLTTSISSGKANFLINVVVGLIFPVLSLQETSEKDLSTLARRAMKLLQWHPFPVSHLPKAVAGVLKAASDNNWHTRIAALTFIQSFAYRHRFKMARSDMDLIWESVLWLASDSQLEVRELAAKTLSGMMKVAETGFVKPFQEKVLSNAILMRRDISSNRSKGNIVQSIPAVHGVVLSLSACILSVPYDIPSWVPNMVIQLAKFMSEPWPIRGTVNKTISEFRHTHSDTWEFQKKIFTEEQLEVLSNLTSSATYFA